MQLTQLKVTDPGGGGLFTYDVTSGSRSTSITIAVQHSKLAGYHER